MIHTFELTRFIWPTDPVLKAWHTASKPPPESGIELWNPMPLWSADRSEMRGYLLRVHVDCLQMFEVRNLTPDLLRHIIPNLNAALLAVGLTTDDFDLYRIDYCYNALVEDPEVRKVLFGLLNEKAPTYSQYLNRSIGQYETTIRSSTPKNTTRTIQFYDKEQERRDKCCPVRDWERGVLRTEVQVRKEHIKQRVKSQHITRKLQDWLTVDQYRHFMGQAGRFAYRGDFYPLPEAKAIVEASGYSHAIKERLISALEWAADYNIDTVIARYTRPTWNGYLARFEELGVNPITLPEGCGFKKIPSPFRFF